ncbi:hypothetical protein FA13DRAFT_377240 [Coprinellus micaceus]|nr:hypothetical protein FA13DRAFT_377240 [Coprinellus micaceus]
MLVYVEERCLLSICTDEWDEASLPMALWRAVWGKSQRAKLICFAQLFALFLTESRNSRGLSKLRNFVVSAKKLR